MPRRSRRPTSASPGQRSPAEQAGDAELAGLLMRRQSRAALGIAALFLLLLVAQPLLNTYWPAGMQARVLGFPFSWLLLGVISYPLTWVLAGYFVRRSEGLEAEDARLVRAERERPS
jgi:uncharacterized membrane protein (DUF485 family)